MTAAARLRPLGRLDHRQVSVLLDSQPERDVYLRSLVWRLGVLLPESSGQLLGWFDGPELTGVFLHSPVIVLACDDPDGLQAFAEFVAGCQELVPVCQLVSPRSMSEEFLGCLDALGALPPVRLLRSCLQGLFVDRDRLVRAAGLPAVEDGAPAAVRPASNDELGLAAHAALAVTREELGFGFDFTDELLFTAALARRIRAGREYLWIEEERLIFRAAIAAATPEAVLVEGVYVPPEERGDHRGTRAMHALCARLLRWHRTVVLFVGAENARARRVYERIGFEPFEDFLAAYFDPRPPPSLSTGRHPG